VKQKKLVPKKKSSLSEANKNFKDFKWRNFTGTKTPLTGRKDKRFTRGIGRDKTTGREEWPTTLEVHDLRSGRRRGSEGKVS